MHSVVILQKSLCMFNVIALRFLVSVFLFLVSWGESAGAISISLHMIANNGDTEGLFRAGFMQSGSFWSLGDVANGQGYYDKIVTGTGCSSSSDTLDCLRNVPYETLKAAIDKTPGFFDYQVNTTLTVLLVSKTDVWFPFPPKVCQFGLASSRRWNIHNR